MDGLPRVVLSISNSKTGRASFSELRSAIGCAMRSRLKGEAWSQWRRDVSQFEESFLSQNYPPE